LSISNSEQFEASLVRNNIFYAICRLKKKSLFHANSKSLKTSVRPKYNIETCCIKRENRYPPFIKSQDMFHPK